MRVGDEPLLSIRSTPLLSYFVKESLPQRLFTGKVSKQGYKHHNNKSTNMGPHLPALFPCSNPSIH